MNSIAKYYKPYVPKMLLVIFLTFLQVMASLGLPTIMANIVDIGIPNGDMSYIITMGLAMLGLSLLQVGVTILIGYFASKVSSAFGRDMRRQVFKKVQDSSPAEMNSFDTASLITRTTNDITQVQNFMVMLMRMVVSAPIMCVGGIIMALVVNVRLSWVVVAAMPFLILLFLVIIRQATGLFSTLQVKVDRLNQLIREHLSGIRVLRAFVTTRYEQKRFDESNDDLTRTTMKVQRIASVLMPAMMIIMNLTTVAIVWFGGKQVEASTMAVGGLMSYIQYVSQIMMSLAMLSMLMIVLPRATVSARRIEEVLSQKETVNNPPEGEEVLTPITGKIEFKDVSFVYPGAKEPVLKNLSFVAERGMRTAIIGSTGSGKSTILNLIPRLFDISGGELLIDGQPVSSYRLETLRDAIGYVPQKGVLFSGTIADNIRYGKLDATEEEVAEAASIAQASDFIMEKDDGFDNRIAQGGRNVSGGQKQRIAIARALVKKAPIYLFDDSFSALDFKTDAKLRQALAREMTESTIIIVAQRISTVMDADRIIVLDEGQVVGIGTHEELLATNALYQEIAHSQLSEEELAI